MAGFLMKQMVGNQLNEVTGGLGLGGGDDNADKTAEGEDPETILLKLESRLILGSLELDYMIY
ncbi:hypothetical protein DICVIV_02151 [Dictyocaulus viviparus]|uniref:Uncharacterized protein n=1 Tax=Dictyocaulus viviparus TaxID=29172 RepID=A0A0D8Y4T5_DICVI|nr:hypothetical protein DICVIV_02151 [Dictyocaulus viviparus]